MANAFKREPIINSDDATWGAYELSQNRINLGGITCLLYDDGGTLKISKGKIGFDDGTNKGVAEIDTITTISMAAVSAGNWAKIEMALTGTTPTFTAADITGATDSTALPAGFTGAWDYDKQGYYITATKRCVGLVWKTAGSVLSGIVNVVNASQGYIGNSPNATFYNFRGKNVQVIGDTESENCGTLHLIPEASRPAAWVLSAGASLTFADVDFSAYAPVGAKALYLKYILMLGGDGATDYAIAPLRKNGSTETDDDKHVTLRLWHTDFGAGLNTDVSGVLSIGCDVNRVIEYYVVNAATLLYLNILGYYS